MEKLNARLLQRLDKTPQHLLLPQLNWQALPEKVLQFGTGVLLRGLPDFFIDKANRQGLFNGRVVIVKSTDRGNTDTFTQQDGLYTLCVRGIDKGKQVEEFIINSSISRILSAKEQWKEILTCAHNPDLQTIISNTTEIGIQLTEDNLFQSPPESFPGKLTAFLYERFKTFGGTAESGMVVIPCELIVDNGKKLQHIVRTLTTQHQLEPAFTDWLEKHVVFCNSLVDRIVPGKPDNESARQIFETLGYEDDLLTVSEVYRLWAIEGGEKVKKFLTFEQAAQGVMIEPDITPYRERKLRLLNGTHTLSVGLGFLYGLETVGQCMNDPLMSGFITGLMYREIVPAVPVDEKSARSFAEEVLDRFRNPYIVHPLINITLQYTSKMKMRNVQTLLNYYNKFNAAPPFFVLGFAAYLLFMKATREENGKYTGERKGNRYPINDDFASYFFESWQKVDTGNKESIRQFVDKVFSDTALWGTRLDTLPGFTQTVTENLFSILENGIESTLQHLIKKP